MRDRIELTYLGHAAFSLSFGGTKIVIDPYSDGSVPGLAPIRERAAAVFSSHGHGDHTCASAVELTGEGCPFSVEELACFHDDRQGAQRGPNTARIFGAGGIRVAHLGDIGHAPDGEMADRLRGLDALLIPVGGCYTIGPAEAAAIARELDPGAVIPMHYRTGRSGYDEIGEVWPFLELMGSAAEEVGSELSICRGQRLGTVVLRQKNLL